jgi:hypothetical protein
MAINLKTSLVSRNAQLNALAALADGGFIRLYEGMQPAAPEIPPGGQLLSELRFSETAFGPANDGMIVANAIADDGDIKASGSATWFRVLKSDGATALWDGSVGTNSADLILATTALVRHAILQITSLTYTLPQ